LAKLAGKGKITLIFFAGGYGIMSTYQGKPDAMFRGGSMVGYFDPVVLISAMGAVTKSVAFGVTGRTSYSCVSPSSHLHSLTIFLYFYYFIIFGMFC
jgi:alkanesulfonate monooxygenase SsuD/methylene tetrahydromethanopterin reductase-like flavin-dependent oxidoreductase (luciferase family)